MNSDSKRHWIIMLNNHTVILKMRDDDWVWMWIWLRSNIESIKIDTFNGEITIINLWS